MKYDIHTHNLNAGKHCIFSRSTQIKANTPFSLGIHPWKTGEYNFSTMIWSDLVSEENCVAIGEIGLDRLKGADIQTQKDLFLKQIELSEHYSLPVIIHCVRAFEELIQLKRSVKPSQLWIIHGFEKTAYLDRLLELEFFISIGHRVLNNEKLQSILPHIPLERLFLETDDSGVSIDLVYEKVAQLLHIPDNQLEKQIETNIKRVFPKWKIG